MSISVFISHSSADDEDTKRFAGVLEDYGLNPWFDRDSKKGIVLGEAWWARIEQSIYSADAFIYLLTETSIQSVWCQKEYKLAQELGKPIFPIIIKPISEIPDYLNKYHVDNLSKELTTSSVSGVVATIRKVLETLSLTAPIGREIEWKTVDTFFKETYCQQKSAYLLIHGRGGIGKSTLITRFLDSNHSKIQGKVYHIADCITLQDGIRRLAGEVMTDVHEEVDVQDILNRLQDMSVLVFDNIESYDGYEILMQTSNTYFFVLTTQQSDVLPRKHFYGDTNEIIREIFLDELDRDSAIQFIKNKLSPLIQRLFRADNKKIEDILNVVEYRSPFYLDTICDILERTHLENKISDATLLLSHVEEISKYGMLPTTTQQSMSGLLEHAIGEEKIVGFPYAKVCEFAPATQLVLATSLFARNEVPEEQLLIVANIAPNSEEHRRALELAIKWGFLDRVRPATFAVSGLFHSFVKRKFGEQGYYLQVEMKARFVRAWLEYVRQTDAQKLWRVYENMQTAIQMINEPAIIDDQSLALANIQTEHLLALQSILGFRVRRRFLSRLLEDEQDIEKIAYIFADLADGYVRAGKFITAEGYAKHSLYCYEQLGQIDSQIYVRRKLGTIYRSKGEFDYSIAEYEQALALCDYIENGVDVALIYRHLAQTYLQMGDTRNAYISAQKSTELLEAYLEEMPYGNGKTIKNSLAYSLSTVGNIEFALGQLVNAERHIAHARDLHTEVVGRTHFYTGYDLLYLAKVQLKLGKDAEALENLKENHAINTRFFGVSPNLARSHLALAEAYVHLGDFSSATEHADKAIDIFRQTVPENSPLVAYGYRVLAEVYLGQGEITLAKEHHHRAKDILFPKFERNPFFTDVKFVDAKIKLAEDKQLQALTILWQVRTDYIKFGRRIDVDKVDSYLLKVLLQDGIDEWDASVQAYQDYLSNFPDALHHQLGEHLVDILLADIPETHDEEIRVLDVFCGTGLISDKIARRSNSHISVTGIDGSQRMIAKCRETIPDDLGYAFSQISGNCTPLEVEPWRYITLHMGINQIDLRTRHFLFQHLLTCLDSNAVICLSTYAADFEFPVNIEAEIPEINNPNGFKPLLLNKLRKVGLTPCSEADSLKPTFTKETMHNLQCFFELYGFVLEPGQLSYKDVVIVERSWEDRIAFTRMPVISRKVFGQHIPEPIWKRIEKLPENYTDKTYGLVIKARRKPAHERPTTVPALFAHYNADFSKNYPIHYAAAGLLKNSEGKTLFLKRGNGARDFHNSWSLPSAFADEGVGLEGSLKESMKRNLDIDEDEISHLEPVSIRFSLRSDNPDQPWIMAMCLYAGRSYSEPSLKTDKYDEYCWYDGFSFTRNLEETSIGDCIKSYRDVMRLGLDNTYV